MYYQKVKVYRNVSSQRAAISTPMGKIPVTIDFDDTEVIGDATLFVDGEEVFADLNLNGDYEELVPCLCLENTLNIRGIALSRANIDGSIRPLKEHQGMAHG